MAVFTVVHTFTDDDTIALLQVSLTDPSNSNAAVDLTSLTPTLYAEPLRGSGGAIGPISGTVQGSATLGVVRFDCTTICAAGVDTYRCQVNLRDASTHDQRSYDFYVAVKEKVA